MLFRSGCHSSWLLELRQQDISQCSDVADTLSRSKLTGGTGLGLAIVKHIVAKHDNAHIELDSELGTGTTIRVVFEQ